MAASPASSIKLGDTDDKLDPRAGQKPELTVEMVPQHASADQASPAMLNESDSDYVQIHTTTNGICELRPGDDGEITIAELEFLMPAPRALVLIKKNRKMLITPKNGIFNQPKCGWKAGKIVAVEKTKTMTQSPPSFLDSSPLPLIVGLNANRKREGSVGVFSNVPTPKRPMISAPSPVRERLTVVVRDSSFVSTTEVQKAVKDSHAEAKFPKNVSSPEASTTCSASVSTTPETGVSMTASDSPNSDVNMSSMTVPMEGEPESSSVELKPIEAATVPSASIPMPASTPPAPFDNIAPTYTDETPSQSVLSPKFVSIASKSLETPNTATNSTKIVNPPPTFKDSNSANAHGISQVLSEEPKTLTPAPKKPTVAPKFLEKKKNPSANPPKRRILELSPKPLRPEAPKRKPITAPPGVHPSMVSPSSMIERFLSPQKTYERTIVTVRTITHTRRSLPAMDRPKQVKKARTPALPTRSQSKPPPNQALTKPPPPRDSPVGFTLPQNKTFPKVIPVEINPTILAQLPDLAIAAAPWITALNVTDLNALMTLPSFCSSCSVYSAKEFQEHAHLFLTAFGPLARYWGSDFVIDHLIFLRQLSYRDNEDTDRRALGTVLRAMETERKRCEPCNFETKDPVANVLHILRDSHLLKHVTTGDVILLKGIMQFIRKPENYYRFICFPK